MKRIRTYSELNRIETFKDRYEYLKLNGEIFNITFGYDRYLNQLLYKSKRWKSIRDHIIIRDNGCDLGVEGFDIHSKILVHHMDPVTIDSLSLSSDLIFDPEFLICTTLDTHNAIHYGDERLLIQPLIERTKNDTCPWLK